MTLSKIEAVGIVGDTLKHFNSAGSTHRKMQSFTSIALKKDLRKEILDATRMVAKFGTHPQKQILRKNQPLVPKPDPRDRGTF